VNKKEKKLKDPLYGYISIPTEIMRKVVDTATFQRLRRIMQTSYSPLYSSAVHNRFVHSIGVFHLGSIVMRTLHQEIEGFIPQGEWESADIKQDRLEYVFLLACLLHDVGHAPFSHTGESFYLENGQDYGPLHKLLTEAVGTESFEKDVPAEKSNAAASHEIMSAIVGIREFGNLMEAPAEKEFFARCITGYGYKDNGGMKSLYNCFIQMLNSKVIDVDKLDYLIRDAYITGYYTVNIDYERLLTALTIVRQGDGYGLAYYKSATSIIENVVYAHDSERKWIQNHPTILYEHYLLQHIMELLEQMFNTDTQRLFSIESLGINGQAFKDGTVIRLLSDDDIIFLAKQRYTESEFVSEYFERGTRRHPLWKSEAEYKAFFLDRVKGGAVIDLLEDAMTVTAKYLSKNTTNWVIDEELLHVLEGELIDLEKVKLDGKTKEVQLNDKEKIYKVVSCLMKYAQSVGYDGDFVLLKSSQFNSGFSKPDFSTTKIVYPVAPAPKIADFGDKVSSLSGIISERDNFFYLYYKRGTEEAPTLNVNDLCRELLKEFFV